MIGNTINLANLIARLRNGDDLSARIEAADALEALKHPCETNGAEDLEPGCCGPCRARVILSALGEGQ